MRESGVPVSLSLSGTTPSITRQNWPSLINRPPPIYQAHLVLPLRVRAAFHFLVGALPRPFGFVRAALAARKLAKFSITGILGSRAGRRVVFVYASLTRNPLAAAQFDRDSS